MIIVSFIQPLLYTAVKPETYNKSVTVIPDDNGTVLVPCGRIGPVTANRSSWIKIVLLDLAERVINNDWTKQKTPEGSFDVYAIANYGNLSNSEYSCKVFKIKDYPGQKFTSQISLESKHGR